MGRRPFLRANIPPSTLGTGMVKRPVWEGKGSNQPPPPKFGQSGVLGYILMAMWDSAGSAYTLEWLEQTGELWLQEPLGGQGLISALHL